nr:protein YgfX [Herminiimonas fonticola]
MSTILLSIAALIATDSIGNLSLSARIVLAGLCASVAITAFSRAMFRKTKYVIHISGTGQIRLATEKRNEQAIADSAAESELVHLLPVSTIWSGLLLLHLQNERQHTMVLTILPDMVSAENFRALLIACRWIVLRHADAAEPDIRH